jgi:cohesin complex subunit SA-1/2
MALAKLLREAFTIHGTHFSVLKQLHPGDAADFHISCLDYITAKIGKLAQQERSNKSKEVKQRVAAKRGQAMLFWKCLSLLLTPINGRDALRLRDKMESWMEARGSFSRQTIASSKHKSWEAYKAYEKRLVQIMSKDDNLKAASQRVVREQATRATQAQAAKGTKRSRQEVEDDAEEDEDADRQRSESLTPTPEEPVPARTATGKQDQCRGKRTALARRDSMMDLDDAAADDDEAEEEQEQGEGDDDLDLPTVPNLEEDDIDIDLELENDLDFANADFPILTQGERGRGESRARSVSVEPVMKKKRTAMVF